MSDFVNTLPPASGTVSTSQQRAAETQAAAENSTADYDDFLTLLTAQLEHQDPLDPQDSTQFVEQLATFSEVEQSIATNSRLDEILALTEQQVLTDLAHWVGKQVNAPGAGFDFSGEEMNIAVPPRADATAASVVVRDTQGREIATLPASPEGGTVTWDGTNTDGETAENGTYQIEFVYGIEGEEPVTERAQGYGTVLEARDFGDGVELLLAGGSIVRAESVTSVRDTDSAAASDDTDTAELDDEPQIF